MATRYSIGRGAGQIVNSSKQLPQTVDDMTGRSTCSPWIAISRSQTAHVRGRVDGVGLTFIFTACSIAATIRSSS